MEKKTWKSKPGTALERQIVLNNAPSDVKCACGCGQFITVRSAREKAKGKQNGGYCKGHIWKGRALPENARQKMRDNHADFKGNKNPNFGKGLSGESNPNWQGGKTLHYVKNNPPGVSTKQDRIFKKKIKERDKMCILCFGKKMLDVHHIEPWMEREDLRFDPLNCVTLCRPHHARADNAHHKERIKPMLIAYIGSLYGEKAP